MSRIKYFFQKFFATTSGNITIGEMIVTPQEQELLTKKGIPKAQWGFELSYWRTAGNLKWDNSTKIRNKKFFSAGWNAAIFTKGKGYMLTDQELEKIERENKGARDNERTTSL